MKAKDNDRFDSTDTQKQNCAFGKYRELTRTVDSWF